MQSIKINESQKEIAQILEQVQNKKEKFLVEYGEEGKIVAMLIPYEGEKTPRIFGPYKGQGGFKMHSDFSMTETELLQNG